METQPFRTSDLYLCCFLLAAGHHLEGIDQSDTQRQVFEIMPYPPTDVLAAYADGTATVAVQAFVAAERRLKRAIFDARDGRGGWR